MASDLTFITTCKGRLHHLQQTLPALAAQAGTECVVVDYGCPQGTRQWVSERFPQVTVVAVDDDPNFCAARARNLGAQAAATARLCFVDADVRVRGDLAAWLRQNWQPRFFFLAMPLSADTWGTCACAAEDFARVGGFDEAMRGWGGEDDDLYLRLEDAGCRQLGCPAALLEPIEHGEEERLRYHDQKERAGHYRVNQLYITAKRHVGQVLGRALALDERRHLFEQARTGVLAVPPGASQATLSVTLPRDARVPEREEWSLEAKLVYRFEPKPGPDPQR